MAITKQYKEKVAAALLELREQRGSSTTDSSFAKRHQIAPAIFSQIKAGKIDGLLSDHKWVHIGLSLEIRPNKKKWNTVETFIFKKVSETIMTCKLHSKAMIIADMCEIGKTHTAKYISRNEDNVFYLDCSQHTIRIDFIRALAEAIGIDSGGKVKDVRENIIIELTSMIQPVVILDEFGDVADPVIQEMKALWNATENICGWTMIGADALRAKFAKGVRNRKISYQEVLSRCGGKIRAFVPANKADREKCYLEMVEQVIDANISDRSKRDQIVAQTLSTDADEATGLRRLETLLILKNAA